MSHNPTPRSPDDFTIKCDEEPITILLVDDDEDCRTLIRDAISACKVSNEVHEARNGREALEFLRRQGAYGKAPRPGLIYLDIEMPGLDGQSVLRTVLASTTYWLTIHQYPTHHFPAVACRR